MDRKYQVFISSTYEDLKDERRAIMEALIKLKHIPTGMESFNAADEEQWSVIKRTIDECDYYVLILSDRYGSTDKDGIGFTEKEYDYAISQNKPVISFVRSNSAIQTLKLTDRETRNKVKLKKFKNKISGKLYKYWDNKEDLSVNFLLSFEELQRIRPQAGWIRYEKFSTRKPIHNPEILDKDVISKEDYSYIDGCYIGYTIHDCKGEKDHIFPFITEVKTQNNKIQGYIEIYYRGIRDVPSAKLLLSGTVNGNKIEFGWVNEKNENHKGNELHTITEGGRKIEGTFTAFSLDTGTSVNGRSICYKI